jgi:CDP-4-dehydro-6-deoxyglucose reductase
MAHRVHVKQTGMSFEVGENESVLAAALRQQVNLAHECTFGGCGTCRVKLLEGGVDYEEFPMALTQDEAQQGYARACQARPRSDLVISIDNALKSATAPQRCVAIVREVRFLGTDVANLRLELPEVAELAYKPGQYMNVHLGDGSHRSFSMASLPAAGVVDFHVRRIAGGRFTARRRVAAGHFPPPRRGLPADTDGRHRHRSGPNQEHARVANGLHRLSAGLAVLGHAR